MCVYNYYYHYFFYIPEITFSPILMANVYITRNFFSIFTYDMMHSCLNLAYTSHSIGLYGKVAGKSQLELGRQHIHRQIFSPKG